MNHPSAANLKKKHLFRKAKLAEEAKRYDHMLLFMKEIVDSTNPPADLSPKERCLLGAAFKNFVALPRDSLRAASAATQCWRSSFSAPIAASYLLKSKTEISSACAEIVQLIDRRLFPSAVSKESKVFYLTLKGDFSWYLAEVKGGMEGMGDAAVATSAYADAWMIAMELDLRNPHRLALDLSMAEHFFKFLRSPVEAGVAVERALNAAVLNVPETGPAVSLLSFEGGLQLIANILRLKQKLRNVVNYRVAQPELPILRPALLPEIPDRPFSIRTTITGTFIDDWKRP